MEEKLRNLSLSSSSVDADHIQRIKSRSPIDPHMGRGMGPKTCETLREIERNRECLLNEQGADIFMNKEKMLVKVLKFSTTGVQMLEEERARVRELQKRVQDAVREEWEASRKSRTAQCNSLNSVGSEDSGTPTDRYY